MPMGTRIKNQPPPGEEDPAGVVITAFGREEETVGLSVRVWEEDDPDKISLFRQIDLRATKGISPRAMPRSFSSRLDRRLSSLTVSR